MLPAIAARISSRRRGRRRLEQRGRRDDLTGRAEAALERVLGDEPLLQERRALPQPLDRRHRPALDGADREQARHRRRAVQQDGAGAARALAAAELRAGQRELVAEHAEEAPGRLDLQRVPLAVDLDGDGHQCKQYQTRSFAPRRSTTLRSCRAAPSSCSSAVLLALAASGCGGDGDGESDATTTATQTETETTGAAAGCQDVEAPDPREDGGETQPTEPLDPSKTWTLTFATSCGEFVVTLDVEGAPETAASLVALAEDGFYDDTVFHRIVPGFVIQGGDPTQSGSGGPGYQTVDAPPSDAAYVKGVMAMAKTATDPAGSSGSQFFVVTGADVGLPPDYAIVGEVTDGLDVVELIGALGDPQTEQPLQPVVIESVTASSS